MSEKKQLKAIKMKLLSIVTENYVAMRYVSVMNKDLLKMDRTAKANELGALRKLAIEIENELTPVNLMISDLEKKDKIRSKSRLAELQRRRENILVRKSKIQVNIEKSDKLIAGVDTAEEQIKKFKARVKEGVFQYKNFDDYSRDIIKMLKE